MSDLVAEAGAPLFSFFPSFLCFLSFASFRSFPSLPFLSPFLSRFSFPSSPTKNPKLSVKSLVAFPILVNLPPFPPSPSLSISFNNAKRRQMSENIGRREGSMAVQSDTKRAIFGSISSQHPKGVSFKMAWGSSSSGMERKGFWREIISNKIKPKDQTSLAGRPALQPCSMISGAV